MKNIENVRIIDPSTGTDRLGDIYITDDIISDIVFREGPCDPSAPVAAPGLVDVHVHFRDPGLTYKEDIETGALAAKAGGFSHVVMMANTRPVIDSVEILEDVLKRGLDTGIHVHSCGAITKGLSGKELTDMEAMLKAGALGFTDDGIPLLDRDLAKRAMEEVARLGCVLSFHEEDPAYIENNGVNRGRASAHYGIGGSDRMAEISMIERDIALALETGARVHFQHISCRESVELIREGKLRGAHITCEATPHHFSLTEEACIEKGTLAKMNPPLREETDRLAIIEGLRDGTIDVIATDHAPHSKEEKDKPITEAPSGIIGLQSALGLGLNFLVKPGHIPLPRLIELMSTAPAKLYGLDRAPYFAGSIKVGGPADILVFDPNMDYKIRSEDILSKSKNSPFVI